METITRNGGSAIMVKGKARGERRVKNAILNAPLLNDSDIEKAEKLMYILYGSKEYPILIDEFDEVDAFTDELNPDIEVTWGVYEDDTLEEYAKVTIIATGFKKHTEVAEVDDKAKVNAIIEQYYAPANKAEPDTHSAKAIRPDTTKEEREPTIIVMGGSSPSTSPLKDRIIAKLESLFGDEFFAD